MSEENVEIVRRVYEFLERGELPFEVADPAIRIDNSAEWVVPGPFHGHEGLRQWWSEITDVLPGARLILEEVIDVGDERVIGVLRTAGGGAMAKLIDEMPMWAATHWVENGLVRRVQGYVTRNAALEAAGLKA